MRPALGSARIMVVALLALSCAIGCAHKVQVTSTPPGAEVLVEDKVVCQTPCEIDEKSSSAGFHRVEVRNDEEAVRFDLIRNGWQSGPIIAGVAAGIGLVVASMVSATVALGAYVFTTTVAQTVAPGNPTLGLSLAGLGFGTVLVAYTATIMFAQFAPLAPLTAAGELSRVSTDRVEVDFEADEVRAPYDKYIRRLVGVSDGRTAMPLPPPERKGKRSRSDRDYDDDGYDSYDDDDDRRSRRKRPKERGTELGPPSALDPAEPDEDK